MNKIEKKTVYSMITIMLLTTSCAYYPHLTGIPLIKKKGDTRVEGGVSFSPPNFQASVSYGVTEKIAIQVAGTANGMDYYGHGAVGFYKNIMEHNVVELYGGFAHGTVSREIILKTDDYQSGNYQMYFTQFNWGNIEKNTMNREFGIGLKLGYMHSNMKFSYEFAPSPNPIYHISGIFVEPTIFTRFGGPKWRFHAALSGGKLFQLTHTDRKIHQCPINFGFGVSCSFGGINKKVNE